MTIWFISDTHFGHENIIKYAERPFSNLKEMDEILINNWNSRIKESDVVYHLGDFCFGDAYIARKYLYQLNGRIHIIYNPFHHDKMWWHWTLLTESKGHIEVREEPIIALEIPEYSRNGKPKPIILCHYPIYVWDRKHYLSWHLYGHIHRKDFVLPDSPLSMNVTADNINFLPISLEEVAKIFLSREKELNLKDIKGE